MERIETRLSEGVTAVTIILEFIAFEFLESVGLGILPSSH